MDLADQLRRFDGKVERIGLGVINRTFYRIYRVLSYFKGRGPESFEEYMDSLPNLEH